MMANALQREQETPPQWHEHERRLPFAFAGSGAEYFGIWIVNIVLSILTLGIYSAWAKVRTRQYFYRSTRLEQHTFDYHAQPIQILKGRLIVVAALFLYLILSAMIPFTEPVFVFVVLPAAFPWIALRSLMFNARYSSYRNIRFRFDGRYGRAFMVYVLYPVASILTVGVLWPYASYQKRRFVVEGARYGRSPFAFHGMPGRFYAICLTGVLLFLPGLILAFFLITTAATEWVPSRQVGLTIGGSLAAVLSGLLARSYVLTNLANYGVSQTTLGPHNLSLEMSFNQVLWLQASNLVLIVLTFGLFTPFAQIRMTRYQIESMALLAKGDLDSFIASDSMPTSALGDEMGEAFDIELGM